MFISASEKLGSFLIEEFRRELKQQGHENTGALSESIYYTISILTNETVIDFYGLDYIAPINTGVPASRIPYSRGSGKKTSKYIEGLIRFFQSKSFNDPKKAAFATANKHKQEGMPSRSSFQYSQNGRRTNFIEAVIEENERKINEIFEREATDEIETLFNNFIKKIVA